MPDAVALTSTDSADDELGPTARRLLVAARELSAARDLTRVMEVVRRAARDLTDADGVTFVLREGEHVHYADEDAIAPLWKGCRFPAGACISGWAMLHRTPVVIEDVYADPRIPVEAYRPTFVRSLAMVPVGSGEPVAAIGSYWATRHLATPREVRLIETLAGFAAGALENEGLIRELRGAVQAREEFLRVAAHELRTPLTAMQLALGTGLRVADREGAAPPLREAFRRAERSADRLGRLVSGLLEAGQRGGERLPLTRAPLDLAGVAGQVADRLRGEGVEIALRADGPLVGSWDRGRIEQVVDSLLSNAIKFGRGLPVEVEVRREGGSATLLVRDRGIGIPPEEQARIFEPFERAVSIRNFSGFGLGLWVVRRNVEAHGGTVELTSRPGEGSTFRVALPL